MMKYWIRMNRKSLAVACLAVPLLGCDVLDVGGDDGGGGPSLEKFNKRDSVQIPNADGGGGFVNNPDNSRDTLKVIFPEEYTGRIDRVTAFGPDLLFFDELYRVKPNEHGNRQRYYGTKPIESYPTNLTVRAELEDLTSIYVEIPVPQQRYD
jgi:hypothetical protein